MAGYSVIAVFLPLMMLLGSGHCETYEFGATFGGESHLNLTSTGFGTLKSNTSSSGIGGEWRGSLFGAGYGNINGSHAAAAASASKDISLKPGDNIRDIKSNNTVVGGKLFFGDFAKKFAKALFGFGEAKTKNATEKPDA